MGKAFIMPAMLNGSDISHDQDTGRQLLFWARASVSVLLGFFLFLFAYCIARRLAYPFHNEWLEGEILCHVVRLLQGHKIYEPPSTAFVAELYPPFYYFVVALAAQVVGVGFLAGRLVSALSCLGLIFLLYHIAVRETGRRSIGLVCSGFFVSFYQIHGGWYDVARVDMLFFVLLIAACFLVAYYRLAWWAVASSALIIVLASFTKQPAMVFVPFLALYLAGRNWEKALCFIGLAGLLFSLIFWALNSWTEGWFADYTYLNALRYGGLLGEKAASLHYNFLTDTAARLPEEMRYEICYKLPVFFAMLAAFLLYRVITLRRLLALSIWELTAIPAVVSYCMIRPHLGSEKNDFMYMTIWGCILLGVLLGRLHAWANDAERRPFLAAVYFLLAIQLVLQLYRPGAIVPAPGSEERGRQFIRMVQDLPGEVFIPGHPFYAVMAGKPMTFSAGAFWGYQVTAAKEWAPDDLIAKIQQKRFTAIIIDAESYYTLLGERRTFNSMQELLSAAEPLSLAIIEHYVQGGRVPYDNDFELLNTTGVMTRPELILVPRAG